MLVQLMHVLSLIIITFSSIAKLLMKFTSMDETKEWNISLKFESYFLNEQGKYDRGKSLILPGVESPSLFMV